VSAVLPSSRSVQVGVAATAFASVINTGSQAATGCTISPATSTPSTFTFRRTDPATNQPLGNNNEAATIAPGAVQTFVLSLTPTGVFGSTEIQFNFACASGTPAPVFPGVNTFLLSSAATAPPDIITIAATLTNDGVTVVPGTSANATGVMTVAALNLGPSTALTVRPRLSNNSMPVTVTVCEVNTATAQCLAPAAASLESTVKLASAGQGFSGYTVFVKASAVVAFQPQSFRVVLEFVDAGGVVRGATSTAVITRDIVAPDSNANGLWDDVEQAVAAQTTNETQAVRNALNAAQGTLQNLVALADVTDISRSGIEAYGQQLSCLAAQNPANASLATQVLRLETLTNLDRSLAYMNALKSMEGQSILVQRTNSGC
jgi:hypothetical protein